MLQITRRDIQAAYEYANRSLSRARDAERDERSKTLKRIIADGTVVAAAATTGMLLGRYGPPDLKISETTSLPLDLTAGLTGHILGFWVGGRAGDHIHNVSTGVLAAYITRFGVGVGTSLRMKAGQPPIAPSVFETTKTAGELGPGGPSNDHRPPLTRAQLAELAARAA